MGWVIKITALSMGLFLLLLTIGGMGIRPESNSEWVALAVPDQIGDTPVPLMQIWPGVPHPLVFWRSFEYFVGGRIEDRGKTAYVEGLSDSYRTRVFYRLDTDNLPLRPILQNYTFMMPGPHSDWVLVAEGEADPFNYWLTNVTTHQRWEVSAPIAPLQVIYPPVTYFTSDSLYITVFDPQTHFKAIVRFSFADGTAVRVVERVASQAYMGVLGQAREWLIVTKAGRLYRMYPDGSAAELLIQDDFQQAGFSYEALLSAYDAYGLAIVQRGSTIFGVDVATHHIVWAYDNVQAVDTSQATANDCILRWQNASLARQCFPSGEIQAVPPEVGHGETRLIGLSPDGSTAYYFRYTSSNGYPMVIWWRFNWDTQKATPITKTAQMGTPVLSPDAQWIWASDYPGMTRISTTDGHTEKVLDQGSPYRILGWMHPHIFGWQPLRLGLVAGILLIFGFLPRRLTNILRRTLSSLRGH